MDEEARFAAARAAFLEGMGHFDAERFADAERCLERASTLLPGRASALVNLGATRRRLGRPADALRVLDEALRVAPADAGAWFQHGHAAAEAGRHADALTSLARAVALAPDQREPRFDCAVALHRAGRIADAQVMVEPLLAAEPADAAAWSLHARLLHDQGRDVQAAAAFQRAIYSGGDSGTNRWFLAALRGQDAPPAAPPEYVQALFDDYAEDFEPHLLGTLRYRAHEQVAQAAAAARPGGRWRSVLDLGCGTGLVAMALRATADTIEGVDLAPTMVERARRRGVYDRLACSDITLHLQATPHRHDLVTAADTFIYVGDLDAVFAGARRVLEPGGWFVFSVEAADGDGFVLRPTLRYAHGAAYLRRLAGRHGLGLHEVERVVLREEQRVPVEGFVVAVAA